MKIYIDSDYKCHVTNDGTMREIEDYFFDDKCDELIEAYRYVPDGESWTRSDGEVFEGTMISPWIITTEILEAQRSYEQNLFLEYKRVAENSVSLSEMDEAYKEGVNSV